MSVSAPPPPAAGGAGTAPRYLPASAGCVTALARYSGRRRRGGWTQAGPGGSSVAAACASLPPARGPRGGAMAARPQRRRLRLRVPHSTRWCCWCRGGAGAPQAKNMRLLKWVVAAAGAGGAAAARARQPRRNKAKNARNKKAAHAHAEDIVIARYFLCRRRRRRSTPTALPPPPLARAGALFLRFGGPRARAPAPGAVASFFACRPPGCLPCIAASVIVSSRRRPSMNRHGPSPATPLGICSFTSRSALPCAPLTYKTLLQQR